ncbi:MAG: efflux RND transporter periplasmic adaptor subunit [Candidimonas sp.]|jgi:membrane fusion protein (multidrug efflux system)
MKLSFLGVLLVLAVGAALGVGGAKWMAERSAESTGEASPVRASSSGPGSSAVAVSVVKVERVALTEGVSAVGSLRSEDSVIVRPEVAGRIAEINFEEGGRVTKGQVLVRLDDGVVKAQLQQARANLSLAQSQYRRAQELSQRGFISGQARDEAASQLKVQQAAAALAQAQLEKTVILAPFDGWIGLRSVSVGDYVSPGDDLVPLESIDPLKVDFRIPEQYLNQVRVGARLAVQFDALPGQSREGTVGAISPLVDVGGRSILLRATIPNADALLRPGMFARVQLQFADTPSLVVPEAALVPSSEGQYVFRLVGDKAQRMAVTVGQRRGGKAQILSGLEDDDQVLVSGLQRVQDGGEVRLVSGAVSND